MKTLRMVAALGAWLLAAPCLAGVPAGPEAADDILRQNPQIKSLAGVPSNLKGVSVQDCPSGRNPDISRSRCVVVYVPNAAKPFQKEYSAARSFVLVLHPDSPKVWGVFDTTNKSNSVLLGEFDTNGRLATQRGSAIATKNGNRVANAVDVNAEPPRTTPSRAEQNTSPADGQTSNQTPIAGASQAPVKNEPKIADVSAASSTNTSGATFSNPLCDTWRYDVHGVLPKETDLRAGPQSGQYLPRDNALVGLLPTLEAADRYAKENCPKTAKRATAITIFLYLDHLPEQLPKPRIGFHYKSLSPGLAMIAEFINGDRWQIRNHVADSYADSYKAEQFKQQVAVEQSKAEEKAKADRSAAAEAAQASQKRKAEFLKRYGAVELKRIAPLFTNPFAFEDKTVLLTVQFGSMTSATTGFFEVLATLQDRGGFAMVSHIPRGALMEPTRLVIAAQVLGKTKMQGPIPMEGLHLKLVGFEKCVQDRCPF